MAKIVGIHRLALNPGVKDADFEAFMRKEVFPGLGIVFQVDKTISHGFTRADWTAAQHLLLRSTQDDEDGTYLWMITADVDDDKVSSDDGRQAVAREAEAKAQEFFDTGSTEDSIAAVKLKPFATRTAFSTYLERARRKRKG